MDYFVEDGKMYKKKSLFYDNIHTIVYSPNFVATEKIIVTVEASDKISNSISRKCPFCIIATGEKRAGIESLHLSISP